MKVKICGITNVEDAKLCSNLGADAIGFIFHKKSKRYVEPELVKKMISKLPPFLIKVGVFVNERSSTVNKIADYVKLNVVQLHGDELPEYLEKIKYPTIKAFRVNDDFNFENLNDYENHSFLLDSLHLKEYGGTGLKFDWDKIPNDIKNKIILAGGISEENIEKIYNEVCPYAIDVSSSVEIEPGKKDHNKLKSLFAKINEVRKT